MRENVGLEKAVSGLRLGRWWIIYNGNFIGVAEKAGMNPSLLRQYSTKKKYPGKEQAKRIQDAIKTIGKELSEAVVYA